VERSYTLDHHELYVLSLLMVGNEPQRRYLRFEAPYSDAAARLIKLGLANACDDKPAPEITERGKAYLNFARSLPLPLGETIWSLPYPLSERFARLSTKD